MIGKDNLFFEEIFIINLYGDDKDRKKLRKMLRDGIVLKRIVNLCSKVYLKINNNA